MTRRLTLALGLSTLLAAPAAAQIPALDIRIGAQAAMPQGDMSDKSKRGFGAYGRVGLPLGMIQLMGTATYARFPRLASKLSSIIVPKSTLPMGTPMTPVPASATPIDKSSYTNSIGLTVGPHLSRQRFDAGVEFGYFFDREKIGIVPSVSVGLRKLDVMASYTMVNTEPTSNWLALGVGLRF